MTTRQLPSFGDLLREYRQSAGLTQEELAERAHLSTQAISALERGINQRPRKDTVKLLAEALELTPSERVVFETTARPPHRLLDAPRSAPGSRRTEPLSAPRALPWRQEAVQARVPPVDPVRSTTASEHLAPPAGSLHLPRAPGRRVLISAAVVGVLVVVVGGAWFVVVPPRSWEQTTLYLAAALQLTGIQTAADGTLYTDVNQVFTGTFGVRNVGPTPTSFLGLGIGVRRPTDCTNPWNAAPHDFPPHEGSFTLEPGAGKVYTDQWSLQDPGVYFAEPLQYDIGYHWTGFLPSMRIWFSVRDPRTGQMPTGGCSTPAPTLSLPAPAR